MAIPGHEFLSAHFSNNERTTVESYWITPDGKETRVEYIEANESIIGTAQSDCPSGVCEISDAPISDEAEVVAE